MTELPSGTVTFVFTDVEGSTQLLHEHGERYTALLAEHRRLLREAFAGHGGVEVDTQGDAFFYAFARASDALAAATAGQAALAATPVRVRIGVHTGEPTVTQEGYVGIDVHAAARISAAAHGGQVLVSERTAGLVDLRGGERLTELGLHRLKDLGEPIRLYQLGEGAFPPPRSLYQSNLPVPANPLVGRKKELADVLRLLTRDAARLVTVTGPGGIGKTRFALSAAAEALDAFPDGVWFVDVASLREPQLVFPTVAATLGARAELAGHLRDKQLLLVLDNLEQVVGVAPDLAALLAQCPRVRLLVTSREALRVAPETEYVLRPLPESPAVELFRQRAGDDIDFALAAAICDRLDRLPLAIELAAARTKVLDPRVLYERLEQRLPLLASRSRDLPDRQRTLRAAIEWSYELLDDDERGLFGRLAVFAGTFELAAAEEVSDAVLETLEGLVDKSLVRRAEGGRLGMLETIREYAAERLDESDQADRLRGRHAEYFLAVAERAEADFRGRQAAWLDRFLADVGNFRLALEHFAGTDDEHGLRLAAALGRSWARYGHIDEGREWLTRFLSGGRGAPSLRARAVRSAFRLAYMQGDRRSAGKLADEYGTLARALGDDVVIASALSAVADVAEMDADYQRAARVGEEAVAAARRSGDAETLAAALTSSVSVLQELGELDEAARRQREALALWRRVGDQTNVACAAGEFDAAREFLIESLPTLHQLGVLDPLARALGGLAWVAASAGRAARAARLLGAHDAIFSAMNATLEPEGEAHKAELLRDAREAIGEDACATALAEGRAMTPAEAVAYALDDSD